MELVNELAGANDSGLSWLLRLGVGPALLLITGWRIVFAVPDPDAHRYCAMTCWSWTEGPGSWLLCALGLLLTSMGLRRAWSLRFEPLP